MSGMFIEVVRTAASRPIRSTLAVLLATLALATITLADSWNGWLSRDLTARVEAAPARTFHVRSSSGALSSSIAAALARSSGVAAMVAFGPSTDAVAAVDPERRIAQRSFWVSPVSPGLPPVDVPVLVTTGTASIASLPMQVVDAEGTSRTVRSRWSPSTAAEDFDGIQVRSEDVPEAVLLTIVLHRSADATTMHRIIERTVRPVVGDAEIDAPTDLAATSAAVRARIDVFRGASAAIAVGVCTGLLSLLSLIGVLGQRRDIGRRRALGATRTMIGCLVVGETALLTVVGCGIGALLSPAVIAVMRWPVPSLQDWLAPAVVVLLASALASVPPALLAATFDPAREMRNP